MPALSGDLESINQNEFFGRYSPPKRLTLERVYKAIIQNGVPCMAFIYGFGVPIHTCVPLGINTRGESKAWQKQGPYLGYDLTPISKIFDDYEKLPYDISWKFRVLRKPLARE